MQTPSFQSWPIWEREDVDAVQNVIESGMWWCGAPEDRAGEQVWCFQEEFAAFQESKHCIAVSNGTVALEAALLLAAPLSLQLQAPPQPDLWLKRAPASRLLAPLSLIACGSGLMKIWFPPHLCFPARYLRPRR